MLHEEHWMFGFSPEQWGPIEGFLGAGRQKGGELFIGGPGGQQPHGIGLKLNEWTWIAFTNNQSQMLFYQAGKQTDRSEAFRPHLWKQVALTLNFIEGPRQRKAVQTPRITRSSGFFV